MDGKNYSVLMSVYIKDNYEYVKMAIDSMLNQTVKPEQYVVVEDGEISSDIEELLAEYDKKYPALFTIVKIETNSGLANALNEGLKACRNELVARMDADDISLPERCEKELEMFRANPELAVCGCNIDEFFDDINDIRTSRIVPSEYREIRKFMRRRQAFNHPSVMYKKTRVIKCGGYPRLKRKEDFELFSKMINNGCYAMNISKSLYLYRADKGNYMRRKSLINVKSSIYVYWRHLKRGGCSIIDFLIICSGEILFYILPYRVMKSLSDKLLREK